ncbi:MAG TPA: IclR family transcriptional regulator [Acidimicrobiales bacterium]|nr:IclR family transcriptional regulator [Acidimicrobiales bacterium]
MGEQSVPLSETHELTYLGRLLDAIEMICGGVAATSYRDAAAAIGVPRSTAHRLLSLLIERGYCDRGEDGGFRPGARLFSMGVLALEQLPQWTAARKVVAELGQTIGESVTFGLLIGDEIVLTARYNSPQALTAVAHVGDILTPHGSALGKAILSVATAEKRRSIVDRFAPGSAEHILERLGSELSEVSSQGYSVDEEVFSPGMRCRAVPVVDLDCGTIGGLSVSGPSARFSLAQAESTVSLLHEAASRLMSRPRPRPAAATTLPPTSPEVRRSDA